MKKVSVIIPCRNEKDFIERAIMSVVDGDYPEELLEIIVCDGMSEDGTTIILGQLRMKIPILKVITNQRKITPVARNTGIQNASGDYLVIFDAHSEMAANYITENAAILEQHPEIWCTGGVWKNDYTNELSKNISFAMSSPFGVGSAHFRTGLAEGYVDTVGTPMYRREVFETTGLFDESLIRNQDDEFNYRLQKAGGKIWLTMNTHVKYYVRPSWKKLFSQYYQYGYWKVYVNKKHRALTTGRQLVPFLFVMFLLSGLITLILAHHIPYIYLFVLILYFALALGSATRFSTRLKDILQIVISFLTLHLSYGLGYAKGIFDFVIANKKIDIRR